MKKLDKIEFDKLKQWLDEGIDLDNRIVEINDVDEAFCHNVCRAIRYMEKISNDPITVIVSSYGGDAYTGFRVYDTLMSSKCKIITKAEGKVMSMGTIIYLAGKERYAQPNTTFMFHEVSSSSGFFSSKASELKNDSEETTRLWELMLGIYGERSKKTSSWWDKEVKYKDVYYDVAKCKKLGIITHDG